MSNKKRTVGKHSSNKNNNSSKHDFSIPLPVTKIGFSKLIKSLLRIEHQIPAGIKVLILFSSIMALLYIILSSLFSFTIIFGAVIQGAAARLINIIIILLLSFMIFGFVKKKFWSYKLAICIFSFVILNSLISMFFIKKSVSGLLTIFVTFSFFFILMMNFITLWYVRHKKNYFLYKYHSNHTTKDDRSFIYGLSTLWLVFFFIAVILVVAHYNETTEKVNSLMDELSITYPYEIEYHCLEKTEDRDLCFLTGVVMYQNDVNSNKLCKYISSHFYRYTCFKAIQGDVV